MAKDAQESKTKSRFIKKLTRELAKAPDFWSGAYDQKAVDRLLKVFVPKDPNVLAVVMPLHLGRQAYGTISELFFPGNYEMEEAELKALEEVFVLDQDLADWDGQFTWIFYYAEDETNRFDEPLMIWWD